jgi:hypothetical protein
MEERGFLSDKFDQFGSEPSPTAWAKVQRLKDARPIPFWWSKLGLSIVSGMLLLGGGLASIYFGIEGNSWLTINPAAEQSGTTVQHAGFIAETGNSDTNQEKTNQPTSGKENFSVGNEQAAFHSSSPVQVISMAKAGRSTQSSGITYQKKQTKLLKTNDLSYADQASAAISNRSNSTSTVDLPAQHESLNAGHLERLSPRSGQVSSQVAHPRARVLAVRNLQRPFASYPLRQTWFGGVMMNYYNISPEVSISKSQLPSPISTRRTGFEIGTQIAKPISAKMDGFAMVSLAWNQYRAQFTKTGDSLTGIDQSQGNDNSLVYAGRFTERTYQVNLRNVALQISGGALFHQVLGGVGLRLGAGVSLAQSRNETSLLGSTSAGFSNANIGILAFAGFPFNVALSNGYKLRIEPTIQYIFRQPVHLSGVASMQPLQAGIRFGLK